MSITKHTPPDAHRPAQPVPPTPTPPRNFGRLWVWTIPLVAGLLSAVLLAQAYAQRGPRIAITFATGHGLKPGDPVAFRGVQVGEIREVRLGDGLAGVRVDARLTADAAGLAVEGARFWIVRPELSLTKVSGLDALLGPRYIEVTPPMPGNAPAPAARSFTGLERPPTPAERAAWGAPIPTPADALLVIVEAERLGSLSIGSPVTYRDIRVGSVVATGLAADARAAEITVAIDRHHAHLLRAGSRFWRLSGVGFDLGLVSGLKFRAESLEAVIAGGIGFATPDRPGETARPGDRFTLADEPESSWLAWAPVLMGEEAGADPAAPPSPGR